MTPNCNGVQYQYHRWHPLVLSEGVERCDRCRETRIEAPRCQACDLYDEHDRCTGETTLGTKPCGCECQKQRARSGEGS